MIDGITVLNSYPEETISVKNLVLALIFIVMVSFLITAICTLAFDCSEGIIAVAVIASIILFMIAAKKFPDMSPFIPTGKTVYEVTIDDSVTMTEFNEKYEVVSQEGKIWTIKEK